MTASQLSTSRVALKKTHSNVKESNGFLYHSTFAITFPSLLLMSTNAPCLHFQRHDSTRTDMLYVLFVIWSKSQPSFYVFSLLAN